MANSRTLLRVPELIEAVNPLISKPINSEDVFRLIGTGDIKPLGFIQRIPVFSVDQIGDIAKKFQKSPEAGQRKSNSPELAERLATGRGAA
jgi:hypothetical protein